MLSSINFSFVFMQKRMTNRNLLVPNMLGTNVCLWGVQRLKEMSFEHNPHDYTYSKKRLKRKGYNFTIIFWKTSFWKKYFKNNPFRKRFLKILWREIFFIIFFYGFWFLSLSLSLSLFLTLLSFFLYVLHKSYINFLPYFFSIFFSSWWGGVYITKMKE